MHPGIGSKVDIDLHLSGVSHREEAPPPPPPPECGALPTDEPRWGTSQSDPVYTASDLIPPVTRTFKYVCRVLPDFPDCYHVGAGYVVNGDMCYATVQDSQGNLKSQLKNRFQFYNGTYAERELSRTAYFLMPGFTNIDKVYVTTEEGEGAGGPTTYICGYGAPASLTDCSLACMASRCRGVPSPHCSPSLA